MRGVSKEIALPFTINGVNRDEKTGKTILGLTARTTLKRKDFGVSFSSPANPNFLGDMVEIELLARGRRMERLPVTSIIQGYLGLMAYMSLPSANALLYEGRIISGVHLLYDTARQDELFRRLKATPVASSSSRVPSTGRP